MRGSRIVYYHTDHLRTPRVLTDDDGAIISKHALFPYGEEVPGPYAIGVSTNSHWLAGHDRSLITGADYMLNRDYDPRLARFLMADPRSAYGIFVTTYHRYAYVDNNPLLWFDPDGRDKKKALAHCALGGFAAVHSGEHFARAYAAAQAGAIPLAVMEMVVGGGFFLDAGSQYAHAAEEFAAGPESEFGSAVQHQELNETLHQQVQDLREWTCDLEDFSRKYEEFLFRACTEGWFPPHRREPCEKICEGHHCPEPLPFPGRSGIAPVPSRGRLRSL